MVATLLSRAEEGHGLMAYICVLLGKLEACSRSGSAPMIEQSQQGSILSRMQDCMLAWSDQDSVDQWYRWLRETRKKRSASATEKRCSTFWHNCHDQQVRYRTIIEGLAGRTIVLFLIHLISSLSCICLVFSFVPLPGHIVQSYLPS